MYVHVRVESTLLSTLTTREVRDAEGWGVVVRAWWLVGLSDGPNLGLAFFRTNGMGLEPGQSHCRLAFSRR